MNDAPAIDEPQTASRRWRRLSFVFLAHFAALVLFRLVLFPDEFVNWDLIGFLNAHAFRDPWSLLMLPEVHFRNPFRFPLYNAGSESVVSLLLHSSVGRLAPAWSSAIVVVFHDVVFLAALVALVRMVFARESARAIALAAVAMSPVVLTFATTSSFNMQAFSTIMLALAGTEAILASRPRAGSAALVVAFLSISQAYGLAFFLPVWCGVWIAARAMIRHLDGRTPALGRNVLVAVAVVAALSLVANIASGGEYFHKLFHLVFPTRRMGRMPLDARLSHLAEFFADSIGSSLPYGRASGGFFPFFLAAECLILGVVVVAGLVRRGELSRRTIVRVAAWLLILAIGYAPAIMGLKSQRAFFGDVFLALAATALLDCARAFGGRLSSVLLAQFFVAFLLSDAYYVWSVMRVSHSHNHMPVFDHDRADGAVRHDLARIIGTMRDQVHHEKAFVILDYPRGASENHTDPAVFYARFLRHFGNYQSNRNLLVTCRFCNVRYGCPFPKVRGKKCARKCCYEDPLPSLAKLDAARRATGYLWTYSSREDAEEETPLVEALSASYRISKPQRHRADGWTSYRLTARASSREIMDQLWQDGQ